MSTQMDDILKDAFSSATEQPLKPGFDKRVLQSIAKRKRRAQLMFTLAIGFVGAIILAVVALLVANYKTEILAAQGYLQGILGFAILLIILQILDKKLVKDKLLKSKR